MIQSQDLSFSDKDTGSDTPQIHECNSAVVPILKHTRGEESDIPPLFQVVQLPDFERRLRLMVDSASHSSIGRLGVI